MPAVSEIGAAFPHECTVAVYSIHDHVINLLDASRFRLISIVTRPHDMTSLSIRTDRLPGGLAPDSRVSIDPFALRTRQGGPVLMEWGRETPVFTGAIRPAVARATRNPLIAVKSRLAESGSRAGLLSLALGEDAPNVYARKALELVVDSSVSLASRLAGLIGLGPGFTPSGDDFVCGALAARATFAPEMDIPVGPLLDRSSSTTPGGATLVKLACEGSFPRYLVRFAKRVFATASDVPGGIERIVDGVLAHGASSGADALAGFVWMAEQVTQA